MAAPPAGGAAIPDGCAGATPAPVPSPSDGSRMPPETAGRWCDAWEIEAAGRGVIRSRALSPRQRQYAV